MPTNRLVTRLTDVLDVLVVRGANVDVLNRKEGDQTLLHLAALTGNEDTAKWPVAHGANVNATSNFDSSQPPWQAALASAAYHRPLCVFLARVDMGPENHQPANAPQQQERHRESEKQV